MKKQHLIVLFCFCLCVTDAFSRYKKSKKPASGVCCLTIALNRQQQLSSYANYQEGLCLAAQNTGVGFTGCFQFWGTFRNNGNDYIINWAENCEAVNGANCYDEFII